MPYLRHVAVAGFVHRGTSRRPRLNRVAWLDVPPIGTRRGELGAGQSDHPRACRNGQLNGYPGAAGLISDVYEYLRLTVSAIVADPPRLSSTVMVPGFVSLRIPALGDTSKLLRIEPSVDNVLSVNVPICLPLEVTNTV